MPSMEIVKLVKVVGLRHLTCDTFSVVPDKYQTVKFVLKEHMCACSSHTLEDGWFIFWPCTYIFISMSHMSTYCIEIF